jgi:membrane-anchored protein YejM (alkaline phosphatase superfamily)
LIYLLPWQFAQFSLATQAASLFALFALGFIKRKKMIEIISAQTVALGIKLL